MGSLNGLWEPCSSSPSLLKGSTAFVVSWAEQLLKLCSSCLPSLERLQGITSHFHVTDEIAVSLLVASPR